MRNSDVLRHKSTLRRLRNKQHERVKFLIDSHNRGRIFTSLFVYRLLSFWSWWLLKQGSSCWSLPGLKPCGITSILCPVNISKNMAQHFICLLLSRECDCFYAWNCQTNLVSLDFTKYQAVSPIRPYSSLQLTQRMLKNLKKIKNTVHKQKCQNSGRVHVRELFTVAEVKISAGIPAQAQSQTERVKKRSGNEQRPCWAEPALLRLLLPSWRSSRERKALGREWEQLKGTSATAVQCPLECTAQQVHSRQWCTKEPRALESEAGRKFVADQMSILLWLARGPECIRTSGKYCSWCKLVLLPWCWQFHGGTACRMTWFAGSAL